MRTAGIICEYNPFHRGHLLQLRKTREMVGEDGAIVCLMSGYFVQRGEPALFSPEVRTRVALLHGADLVLELPITGAVNAAGYFAETAVSCLHQMGCIDLLSFGSESGNLEDLCRIAEILDSAEMEAALKARLETGASYASARTLALGDLGADGALLRGANNALGVEYLRSLRKLGSEIAPWTYCRDLSLPSASEIRGTLGKEDWLDHLPGKELYRDAVPHTLLQGEKAMLAVLRALPDEAFDRMAFDGEGLSSKVRKACRRENSIDGIIMACKSKRYAYSRLRRTLMWLFLGLSQADVRREIPYVRVLGFNETGRKVLKMAKETGELPLVSGAVPKNLAAREYFLMESRAADLYTVFAPAGVREDWDRLRGWVPVRV